MFTRPANQFAPELIYFSDCILHDKIPEPNRWEGLEDLRVIRAIYKAAEPQQSIRLLEFEKRLRPSGIGNLQAGAGSG
jgi:hypothetical protein